LRPSRSRAANADAVYGGVTRVVALARNAGIERIGFVLH